ncbi:unnamed protein product [Linum trigynum]|uniref:Uncharacterized protein n=1 Tax=Linum trigynum TaxID=586398 RepID=A0AAV2EMG8_9ROSI
MLDYTCRPPRPTGLLVFSGGIYHRFRRRRQYRHQFHLPPFLADEPATSARGHCRATVVVHARMGRSHLIRNGGEASDMREKMEEEKKKKKEEEFPDELLPWGWSLPEDWTY